MYSLCDPKIPSITLAQNPRISYGCLNLSLDLMNMLQGVMREQFMWS
jgi:hypothetical protein